jgi:micrococcal nuclease
MGARTLILGSLALAVTGGCAQDATPPAPEPSGPDASGSASPATPVPVGRGSIERGQVAYVSDGDTIGVRLGTTVRRVRLLGIDAPETKDPSRPVACFGPQASGRAAALLPRRTTVTVVTDPTQGRVDRYGRLLAYVFVRAETRPVNERLLADGAARVYVYRNRPFRRLAAFRLAEQQAKAIGRGLWGACPR